MKNIYSIILVLIFMTILILEKSSCFEVIVVGLLLSLLIEIENDKGKKL